MAGPISSAYPDTVISLGAILFIACFGDIDPDIFSLHLFQIKRISILLPIIWMEQHYNIFVLPRHMKSLLFLLIFLPVIFVIETVGLCLSVIK